MSTCGSPCACQASFAPPTGRVLFLHTGNRHTAGLLRSTVAATGALGHDDGQMLRVHGTGLDRVLLALRTAVTATEAEEVRVFFADGAVPSVSEALSAEPLRSATARVEHAPVLALLNDEAAFYSLYQPIVDLQTGATHSYEALLRADGPDGQVQPGTLFGAAESAGKIHLLDRIGRETAIRGAGGWLSDQSLFVNFIPTSIYRPEVCLRTTMRAADAAGIDPSQIVFEVVESHAVTDPGHLLSILDFYRSSGCRVALDDVGAGYSSLNLMAAIRPDVVKIDRDLVQGLPDPASVAVFRAIVDLGHELGAKVIAECVETEEQARIAAELGADWAQGWFFGRPQPAVALASTASV